MKTRSRNILLAVCAMILLCIAAFVVWSLCNGQDIEQLRQRIYALPNDTTAAELEKEGYLNLSEVQSELPAQFVSLMKKDGYLKTFIDTDEGPVVQVYASDCAAQQLVMYTNYYIRGQYEKNPGRTFHLRFEEVETESGIIEVWLRACAVDRPGSNQKEDYLLLKYKLDV